MMRPHRGHLKQDLFISYASEDRDEYVRPMTDALAARGVLFWWDLALDEDTVFHLHGVPVTERSPGGGGGGGDDWYYHGPVYDYIR
jgi:hypothetical protein